MQKEPINGPNRKRQQPIESQNDGNLEHPTFCWSQLQINGTDIDSPTRLRLDFFPVIVDDIKRALKLDFSDYLVGIPAAKLEVYAANFGTVMPLKASTQWDPNAHGGDTEENALIVKMPASTTPWITLIDRYGKIVETRTIKVARGAAITNILDGMRQVFPITLEGVRLSNLMVYTATNEANTTLKANMLWDPKSHGGDTEENALIVKINDPEVESNVRIGRLFLDSIMGTYEDIPNSAGMKVLLNVSSLETEGSKNVVVRNITGDFWEKVLEYTETEDMRVRVCAIGTPGIGKTTATVILIRMLLLRGKTVFYHVRTITKNGWVYIFSPSVNAIGTENYCVRVVRESDFAAEANIKESEAYYVVDPGQTEDNCNPSDNFKSKYVLVTSPEDGHWGKSEFQKLRDKVIGVLLYFPVWTYDELHKSKAYFQESMSDQELEERFRLFGGVPRHVFLSKIFTNSVLTTQDVAINALTSEQLQKIATQSMSAVETISDKQPKSAILGIHINGSSYERSIAGFISDAVIEKVTDRYMSVLWLTMSSNADIFDPWIFEIYCRKLLTKQAFNSTMRKYTLEGLDEKTFQEITIRVGGCSDTKLSRNILEAAKDTENVVFCHIDRSYPLIDFVYRVGDTFYAIQCTLAKTRKANPKAVYALVKEIVAMVEGVVKIVLIYMLPECRFDIFKTDPINPFLAAYQYAEEVTKNSRIPENDKTNATNIFRNWTDLMSVQVMALGRPNGGSIR